MTKDLPDVVDLGYGNVAVRCPYCTPDDKTPQDSGEKVRCSFCGSVGWAGVNPTLPTVAYAGTAAKQVMQFVRAQCGLPLDHPEDEIRKVLGGGWRQNASR